MSQTFNNEWTIHGMRRLIAVLVALSTTSLFAQTGKLVVRVVDQETRKLLPARLVLRASDGTYPGDRMGISAKQWPHIEGHAVFVRGEQSFEVPAGRTAITAARGLDYRLDSTEIDVPTGGNVSVEMELSRVVDLRKAGWVSGDLHVHMLHGENQRPTSYADVALTCEANGLDFVSVGQEYVGAGELDLAGFHAACAKVSHANFRMLLGGERPKSLLGHQVLLGVQNPFVIDQNPPYFKSARKVHQQGGVLLYVHPVRYYPGKQYQGNWLDFPGNNLARELLFDAYTGPSFDGLSVLSDEAQDNNAWQLWFQLLNRGCFVPIFADSDACFDRPTLGFKAPGLWSTYFYVGAGTPIDATTLTTAVRKGQTFATTGPLLQFQIDGQISGATLPIDGKPRTVEIEAWHSQHAFSLETTDSGSGKPVGIAKVELIRNGQIVQTWEPNTPHVKLTHTVNDTAPCWYIARVFGTDQRWQVGASSPIYFASNPVPSKRPPLNTIVRGRIYDFQTGAERLGTVEIWRGDELLKTFEAHGPFRVKLPLDAEISVKADGFRPIRKNLLLDYGPVHKFLWYLESKDLGKPETFDLFEHIVQSVDLEFPLGYQMSGSYIAADLPSATAIESLRVLEAPPQTTDGTVAIAAVLMDTTQVAPGDSIELTALFRDEGDVTKLGPLVVEARGYDPQRPTAYGALKKFAEFETSWTKAKDLSNGFRVLSGKLQVPPWVQPGPTGGIDISVRARQGHGDAAWIGLKIPLGPTQRALSLTSAWPTMPISWPDGQYGIGPFLACNRIGREAQSKADYRQLHLALKVGDRVIDMLPARDGQGCPDADDAMYTGHFLDQSLSDQSNLAKPDGIRTQPAVHGPASIPLVDATSLEGVD
jgi:hypothetical protein